MVKRGGGTKRKISKLEKIPKREYLATAFTKRCYGLHSKAAQLCLLADAQIAILATPPSSHSNVSFFSFGHSSVDAVVSAYLTGQRLAPVREEPREEDIGILMARKELGLELWWEKESLSKSKDPRELMAAVKAMERVLTKLRSGDFIGERDSHHQSSGDNKEVGKKNDVLLHQGTQDVDETLNLKTTCCIPDDDDLRDGFDKIITEQQDPILASIFDRFCAKEDNNNNNINGLSGSLDVCNQEMDIDELMDLAMTYETLTFDYGVWTSSQEIQGAAHEVSTNPNPPVFVSEGVEEEALVLRNMGSDEATNDVSMNPNPPIFVSEGVEEDGLVLQNIGSDEAANDVSSNLFPIYDLEGVEDKGFMYLNRGLCEDNLHFSDYFNHSC